MGGSPSLSVTWNPQSPSPSSANITLPVEGMNGDSPHSKGSKILVQDLSALNSHFGTRPLESG